MASFIDIAKRRVSVPLQGLGIDAEVFGISAAGLVYLVERFPQFRELIFPSASSQEPPYPGSPVPGQRKQSSRAVRAPAELSDAPSMFRSFPEALPAILAAGTGHLGDMAEENALCDMGADDQIALLDKIMELTMPNGITAFLTRLTNLLGDVGRPIPLNASGLTPSPSVPNERALDTL
jgi:hypothetical protein